MKKLQLSILSAVILFSGSAMANKAMHHQPVAPNETPACSPYALCSMEASGFYIGLKGIDAVPSETGLGMFSDSWQTADASGNITGHSRPIKPAYKMQGAVKIGYDIPGTGNNIEASYFWLNSSTHAVNRPTDDTVSFGSVFFNTFIPSQFFGTDFVSDAHLKYRVNQADLSVGRHYVDASGHFQLHPYGGVRYANLKHDLTFAVGYVRSKYDGIGPMLGFDGHFDFGCGFGAAGKLDAALLMGKVDAKSELRLGDLVPGAVTYDFNSPKTNRVVTSANAQLGLDYTYMLGNQSRLKLEIGYQVSEFFSPFDILRSNTVATSTDNTRITGLESTNFSYSGPFAELSWHV